MFKKDDTSLGQNDAGGLTKTDFYCNSPENKNKSKEDVMYGFNDGHLKCTIDFSFFIDGQVSKNDLLETIFKLLPDSVEGENKEFVIDIDEFNIDLHIPEEGQIWMVNYGKLNFVEIVSVQDEDCKRLKARLFNTDSQDLLDLAFLDLIKRVV
jgi:hypothetical protein